jgi:hypothetical protein
LLENTPKNEGNWNELDRLTKVAEISSNLQRTCNHTIEGQKNCVLVSVKVFHGTVGKTDIIFRSTDYQTEMAIWQWDQWVKWIARQNDGENETCELTLMTN